MQRENRKAKAPLPCRDESILGHTARESGQGTDCYWSLIFIDICLHISSKVRIFN